MWRARQDSGTGCCVMRERMKRILEAGRGTALGHLGDLYRENRVRSIPATGLITPTNVEPVGLGPEGQYLAEVLGRHVEITDIHDERTFYDQLTTLIGQAQTSIWMWSACGSLPSPHSAATSC